MSALDSFATPCGPCQQWNAHDYAIDAGFVPTLGGAVARLLDARPGEQILDLGCGDGVLSIELALGGAHVTGVDHSPELVNGARARGIPAQCMDAHALCFERHFDAVFSSAALHWMHDQDRVIDGVRRALKRNGRFVAEMGGQGDAAAVTSALQAALISNGHALPAFPWHFPSADDYATRLRSHGFQVRHIECLPCPTVLPGGMQGWLRSFAAPFLAGLDAPQRQHVLDAAVALLEPGQRNTRGQWTVDHVRLRFDARLRPA